MAIFRVSKEKNFSIIDNQYLKDRDLSFGAIGLMTVILSCKDDTKFSLKLISIITGKSIKLVTKYLNELKKNYYINVIKHNSKNGYYYDYFVYESKQLNPNYIPDYQNPVWESQQSTEDVYINNNYNINKINIDKSKLNLCFLTEYLIDWEFIKLNDINLFSYDSFLIEFLKDEDVRQIISIVNYVVKRIKDNNYLDEENNPIINLLPYFKESCRHNLTCIKAQNDPHLFDHWG